MNRQTQESKQCGRSSEEEIFRNVADHAVKKTFAILGVDIDEPESVEEFRQDLRFGKRLRKISDHAQLGMVALVGAGIVYAIWEGIKSFAHGIKA